MKLMLGTRDDDTIEWQGQESCDVVPVNSLGVVNIHAVILNMSKRG